MMFKFNLIALVFLIFLMFVDLQLGSISAKAQNIDELMNINAEESLPTPSIMWTVYTGESFEVSESDLRVFPDGKVLLGSRFCNENMAETSMPSAELQQILELAINEHEFFAINAEKIKADIKEIEEQRESTSASLSTVRAGSEIPYLDTGTSVIQIAANNKRHKVVYDALFATARDFPEILSLQQLRAIEVKLAQIAVDLSQEVCNGNDIPNT